jgi:hypothetical protein
MRSGDKVFRDQAPAEFRMHIGFMVAMGAALYLLNLVVAWLVLSRPH